MRFLLRILQQGFWLEKVLPGQEVLLLNLCPLRGCPSATAVSSSGFSSSMLRLEGKQGREGGILLGWMCKAEIQISRPKEAVEQENGDFKPSSVHRSFSSRSAKAQKGDLCCLPSSPLTGTWVTSRDSTKTMGSLIEEEVFPSGVFLCSALFSPVVTYSGSHSSTCLAPTETPSCAGRGPCCRPEHPLWKKHETELKQKLEQTHTV